MDRISVTIFQQVIIIITLTTRLEVTSIGYGAITIPLTDQLTVEEGDVYGFHFDQTSTGAPFTYTVSQSIQHNSLSTMILHRAPPPRLQVDQNFLTQKIMADLKMQCHQNCFGIFKKTYFEQN